jgi:hypothetical protein
MRGSDELIMLIASLFRLISSPIRLIGSSTVVGGRQGIDDVAGVDDVAVKMQASEGTRAVVVGTRVGRGRGGARAGDGARELVSHLQDRGWRGVIEIDPVT